MEALRFLLNMSERLALSLKTNVIQVNSPSDFALKAMSESGYKTSYDYFTFILDLTQPIDRIWCNLKKQVRNGVKKAEKTGVKVIFGKNQEFMDRIYAIHVNNMKRLGTPPHSKKFFKEMWNQMHPKDQIRTYLAEYDGKEIAAVILFPHRESVRWGTGVSLTEYRWLNPIYLLLWEAIVWSKQEGYAVFDMGGSRKDSGNFHFKEAWIGKDHSNGRIVTLNHLHLSLRKSEINIVNPQNPRYVGLTSVWHRCVPMLIANSFGPYLRKQIAM
jgi:lipid II:glycine glycyltransferase (peptidoglycan interpeptide bridge formation enzyme)